MHYILISVWLWNFKDGGSFVFWKKSVDFWHRKLTFKVQFWHFLLNHNSLQDCFEKNSFDHVDCWAKILHFRTHQFWNSTIELTLFILLRWFIYQIYNLDATTTIFSANIRVDGRVQWIWLKPICSEKASKNWWNPPVDLAPTKWNQLEDFVKCCGRLRKPDLYLYLYIE